MPEGGEILRVVAKEKTARKIVELNEFLESLEELNEVMKEQKKGLKIKFNTRRERMAFYSGKTEEILAKYEEMKFELEEVNLKLKKIEENKRSRKKRTKHFRVEITSRISFRVNGFSYRK